MTKNVTTVYTPNSQNLIFGLPRPDKIPYILKRIFKWLWRVIRFAGSVGLLGLFLPRLITSLHA